MAFQPAKQIEIGDLFVTKPTIEIIDHKPGEPLEVRCCCDAHLIGYLLDPDLRAVGQSKVFAIRRDINPFLKPPDIAGPEVERTMRLSVSSCSKAHGNRVHVVAAIKSNDYPIELLRTIPGFREATPEELWADKWAGLGPEEE